MIDDRTVNRLLDHIACRVLWEMRDGKRLEEIDGKLFGLRKKIASPCSNTWPNSFRLNGLAERGTPSLRTCAP
jgi:hypothetical protein